MTNSSSNLHILVFPWPSFTLTLRSKYIFLFKLLSTGVDDVPGEVLEILEDGYFRIVEQLFNNMYETAEWPNISLKSTAIFLKKKLKAKKCCNYRKISLIAHTATTVARTRRRTRRKRVDVLGEDQFGFRIGKGSRECNWDVENNIRTNFGQRRGNVCVLHRLPEGV
jgi:hypothetical protein